MFNYKKLLTNHMVIKNYTNIDKINEFPFNHGLKHVRNVCEIIEELCDILRLDKDMKEALLIAGALHDIGQIDGRKNHGLKAKSFLLENFDNEIKQNKYYLDILEAVEKHDNKELNTHDSLFVKLIQFADKMDFSKKRLENNYRNKFRYYIWENVESVGFTYNEKIFSINIITDGIDDFYIKFRNENFSKKIIANLISLSKKLNRIPKLLVNGEEQDIYKSVICPNKTLLFSNIIGDVTLDTDVSFNDSMIEYLKYNIDSRYSMIFFDAPGLGGEENYLSNILKCFNRIGITFKEVLKIDENTLLNEFEEFYKNNEKCILFLMGGNPYTQIKIIDKLGIRNIIKNHGDVVIGFCAGAINLSKYSIISSDDDFEKPDSYYGIGRENICIEPHYNNPDDDKRNKELKQFSRKYNINIYCIPDESIIYFEYGKKYEKGTIYTINN